MNFLKLSSVHDDTVHIVVKEIQRHRQLRTVLLGLNTLMMLMSVFKMFMSTYMLFWFEKFWWGLGSFLLSLFATIISVIYYPLISQCVRLDIVKVVLIFATISNIFDTGCSVWHAITNSQDRNGVAYMIFTTAKGLHLGVVFAIFTYYWELYDIASLD